MKWSKRRTYWSLLEKDKERRWKGCNCTSNRRLKRFLNKEDREKLLMLGFKWPRH